MARRETISQLCLKAGGQLFTKPLRVSAIRPMFKGIAIQRRNQRLADIRGDMTTAYLLRPLAWAGLTETPPSASWLNSSPVLITGLMPLKTGQGHLRIDLVQPLYPGGGQKRAITARVVQKARTHLTCLFEENGESRTAVLQKPDFSWLECCCAELLRRRPVAGPAFHVGGVAVGRPTWEEHLTRVFGNAPEEVLVGATRQSFPVKLGRMPSARAMLMIDRELDPLDSALAVRGHVPREMEDKWFVLFEKGRLLFHRSWTGNLIYDLAASWRGDRLYLGQAYVNRRPAQYSETDDRYDTAILGYLIDVLLRGVPADFPATGQDSASR